MLGRPPQHVSEQAEGIVQRRMTPDGQRDIFIALDSKQQLSCAVDR